MPIAFESNSQFYLQIYLLTKSQKPTEQVLSDTFLLHEHHSCFLLHFYDTRQTLNYPNIKEMAEVLQLTNYLIKTKFL